MVVLMVGHVASNQQISDDHAIMRSHLEVLVRILVRPRPAVIDGGHRNRLSKGSKNTCTPLLLRGTLVPTLPTLAFDYTLCP